MTKTKRRVRASIATACVGRERGGRTGIGVTLSTTGPAASLGIPRKNTIALLPKEFVSLASLGAIIARE